MLEWYTKQDLMENAGFKIINNFVMWPFENHLVRINQEWTAEQTWNEAWATMQLMANSCQSDARIQAAYTAAVMG